MQLLVGRFFSLSDGLCCQKIHSWFARFGPSRRTRRSSLFFPLPLGV